MLFGGTPPTNTFRGRATLPGGNSVAIAVTHTGYSPYLDPTTQGGPSYPLGYIPMSSDALGGPFLSGGTYPWGKNPFTIYSYPQQ